MEAPLVLTVDYEPAILNLIARQLCQLKASEP